MPQFHVPQFIEVEDTIIGPITVRQFITLIIGAFFCFIEYKMSDFALFLVLAIFTIAIAALFAFFKVNGVSFHYFLLNMIETLKKPKIRTWARELWQTPAFLREAAKPKEQVIIHKPLVRASALQDLSLLIDTGGQWQPATPTKTYGGKQ